MLTPGPQRGPLVTQQISVWHTVQRIQSQPSFFCTMMWHVGQCMASPSCTRVWGGGGKDVVREVRTSPPLTPSPSTPAPQGAPTCSMSLVCRAAASFCARSWRSSWYCRQFFPSWMAWGGWKKRGSAQPPSPVHGTEPPPQARHGTRPGEGWVGAEGQRSAPSPVHGTELGEWAGPPLLTLQSRQLRAWQMGQRNSLTESS